MACEVEVNDELSYGILNDGFTFVLSGRTVLFVTVSAGCYPGLRKPLGFQPVSACMRELYYVTLYCKLGVFRRSVMPLTCSRDTQKPRKRSVNFSQAFQLFQFQLCFRGSVKFQTPFLRLITN